MLVWLGVSLCCTSQAMFAAIDPDFLMDSDPQLGVPQPVASFNPALKTLWMSALERPEIDMQRMAAETIARAHEHGMPDLIETVPELEKILLAESSHPAARFAAARALIVLQSRNSAAKLFDASKVSGADFRQLIEPALARWDYPPARAIWQDRLDAPETNRRDLILAMRGLAQVREQAALPKLMSCAGDLTDSSDIRLEAATAVGQIADTGLEQSANRLAHDTRTPYFTNQLCAIRFLARHHSEAARQLLIELARHEEPVVAATSLSRLNEIDSELVLPLVESALKSRDPHVRMQGATAYLRLPSVDRIGPLCELLADPHPRVRQVVSEGLLLLSEDPEFHDSICGGAFQVLAGNRWQTESVLLLGELEYKPAANRLVELLESPRPEVMVAAAWALRKVAAPETIPALIDKASRQTEHRKHETTPGLDEQVAHLFEGLGVLKAMDAAPVMRQYIPKEHYIGDHSRGAAIWAIGRLKEGTRDSRLEDELSERIRDFADKQPETPRVKRMCVIALARMNAADQSPLLRGMVSRTQRPIELAVTLRWAVKQLTGEELPPPEPLSIEQGNWFLEPIP